ncbi:elongation factor P 5-aminopentanone reductase [Vagococcus humatus]|uniref:3-oxoacyl-ACP reductase n=1 Tax=Vagococcus humatus TaxID=1889241 RepID=A0A3R9YJJ7_9ENTE|nr:SDR family NAD(P)-dependent oxidoreductase [Vagococcus humatus]RST89239.1 3-oxoacyl-ACP reductase [Vagococcus humatus]
MKYALILGASGDIGRACAKALAEDGWSLYCHYYHHKERVVELNEELRQLYPKQDFFSVGFDMTHETSLEPLLNQLFQVDSIIFANGKTVYKLLTDTTSQEIDELWQLMIKTPMCMCQALQSKLSHQHQGRIIFIGSVYGLSGSSMEVAYSTVKGAQQSFAKAYAQEVSSLGITVNVVAPGAVNTQMNANWTDEEKACLLAEIPMRRMAEPKEVAQVVRFLVKEEAGYITGTTIPITGGWKI